MKKNEKNIDPPETVSAFPFHVLGAAPVDASKHTVLYFERKNYKICTIEYVCSGTGYLEIDGYSYTAGPGSLFILHKGSNHRYWTEQGPGIWYKLCWELDGDMVEELFHAYGLQNLCFMKDAQKLKPYFEELIGLNLNEQFVDLKAAVIFHRFVSALFQEHHRQTVTSRIPPVVQKLMAFITAHVNEKLELQSYADRTGVSVSYLIRSFRAAYQATPLEYQLRLKYYSALRMLNHHVKSIKEISEELGFADQFYFSKFFRKYNGKSPARYRAEIGRNELAEDATALPAPPPPAEKRRKTPTDRRKHAEHSKW